MAKKKNRMTVRVETHADSKTLSVRVTLPGHAPLQLTGDLENFRNFVEVVAMTFGPVEGKGWEQDFRADMRRVEVAAEAEFAGGG